MGRKTPVGLVAVLWSLGVLLAAAVLVLGPVYLLSEASRASEAGYRFRFFAASRYWSREVLAALHVLFLGTMAVCATFFADRVRVGRLTGMGAVLGLWEILVAVLGGLFFAEKARFAQPEMTLAALGALLLLGGLALNVEALSKKLASPKTPVVFVFSAGTALGLVAFALVGVLNVRHYARVDYTRTGRYSLPEPTVRLLRRLDKTVRITTLFVVEQLIDDALKREATDLLREYARISGRIEVRHIDFRRQPKAAKALARRLRRKGIRPEKNSVIFECPDTGRVIKLARYEMIRKHVAEPAPRVRPGRNSSQAEKRSRGARRRVEQEELPDFRFIGKSAFHEALSLVTRRKPVQLYFVVGHGEKPEAVGPPRPGLSPAQANQLDAMRKAFGISVLKRALRRRYYRIDHLRLDELDEKEGIPKDCDVLVIAGPWNAFTASTWDHDAIRSFSRKDAKIVHDYLDRGGRALIMMDPVAPYQRRRVRPLLDLLRDYGVRVHVGAYIMDRFETLVPYGGMFLRMKRWRELFIGKPVRDYPATDASGRPVRVLHPCIRALSNRPKQFVVATEINTAADPRYRHTRLMTTKSDQAWLWPVDQRPTQADQKDKRRRTVAVAVEKRDTGQPVMVVLGSSNMFIEQIIRFEGLGHNDDLALKLLAWLSGSTEQFAVRRTEAAFGRIDVASVGAIRLVSIFVLPSVFILVGAVVWIGRRN